MKPRFSYSAYDNQGAKVTGELESTSKDEALLILKNKKLVVIEIKQLNSQNRVDFFNSESISLKNLEFFTSELSLLLKAGLKIDKAIAVIANSKNDANLARLLSGLLEELKNGSSLSDACRRKKEVFDPLYCNLIALGEETGQLSKVFSDLAKDLAFKKELQSKIISALIYPIVIFSVCILSVFFIFNVIIPRMAVMFNDVESLPWYTQAILDISEWMQSYQLYLLAGGAGLTFGLFALLRNSSFSLRFNRLLLHIPVVKVFILNVERIRFNSALAMMLRSGIVIDQALLFSCNSIKNTELRATMEIARKKIKEGTSLTESMKNSLFYSGLYVSLLEVGEQTGTLDAIFSEIAERSKKEFESWIGRVTTLLEPLMILFMGGVVGTVVVVMLLSMVSLNDIGV